MQYAGQEHFFSKVALGVFCGAGALMALAVSVAGVVVPPLVPAMFGGLVYAVICLNRPLVAFCMALFGQVFDQLLLLVPYTGSGQASFVNSLTVPKMMFATLVLVLAARVLLTKDESPLRGIRAHTLFILLAVMMLLGSFPALIYSGINGSFIIPMSRLVNCMALAFATLALIRDFRSITSVFATLLPAFVITSIMGIYEVLTESYVLRELGRPIPEDYEMSLQGEGFRVLGPSGDAVYYAVSLLVALVCALVVMQVTRRRWVLLFCLVSMGLFGIAMLSTASRGAVLGVAALGTVFFLLAKIRYKWWIAGTAVMLCVLGVVFYTVCISVTPIARFTGHSGADEGTTVRLGLWSESMRMAEDSPIVGIGMGQFNDQHINSYFDARSPSRRYLPHNVYLQILAETGFVTLLIYIAILLASCLPLLGTVIRLRKPRERNVGAAILGGVVGLAVFATNTNLRENELVWLLLAMAVIATEVFKETAAIPPDEGRAGPAGPAPVLQGGTNGAH